MKMKETPAERWARWKAQQSAAKQVKRRAYTISDQRRVAQKASVKARRRNAMLLSQCEREKRRREDAILQNFLCGLPVSPKPLTSEQQNELDGHWAQHCRLDQLKRPLYTNPCNLACVRQLLGTAPLWVRAYPFNPLSNSRRTAPRMPWWRKGRSEIRLAIRVLGSEYVDDEDGKYWHHLLIYYLKPYDLLTHIAGTSVPGEAVSWERLLATASCLNHNVPTTSISKIVRSTRSYLRWARQRERTYRPPGGPQAGNTIDTRAAPATISSVSNDGKREEAQDGRANVASA